MIAKNAPKKLSLDTFKKPECDKKTFKMHREVRYEHINIHLRSHFGHFEKRPEVGWLDEKKFKSVKKQCQQKYKPFIKAPKIGTPDQQNRTECQVESSRLSHKSTENKLLHMAFGRVWTINKSTTFLGPHVCPQDPPKPPNQETSIL